MGVPERHFGNDAYVPFLDCAGGSINFNNVLFGIRGIHNKIFHHLVYILVELYVHEDSLYYYTIYGIYFHNPFYDLLN